IGAVSVKKLEGEVRIALTGTPMENHIGELWSVMDFVLPGYLGEYGAFMRKFTESTKREELKSKISPFLLRRLKKDVLQELPDKIETVLVAQMSIEQHRAYQAALLRVKRKVNDLLDEKGFGQGRMEVLAAITELRQMCCHPALVLPEYSGSSGKLDLLLDIVPVMIENNHRILLFSQFTSMLKIIQRHLEAQNITCFYLDGETKANKRLELVESFNGGEGQVFLISLKAGGTGLNLTGADTVIHYDPWWNPAAEDQATDRVHRIGQKKKVEVIRLITHESIEEQVAQLSQKKKALFDQLIIAGEQMPTTLSQKDIEALFA
ncbi:MAG: DEAD/DEAH box helicase, partial [Clostridiales bacterium]|nr:DEAD/DEAH box helicase [Clostridiales bacterium]